MGTRVTKHYDIQGDVDFLDVHVEEDNRLFIDPSRIRATRTSDKYAKVAYELLCYFFDEVLRCLRSDEQKDRDRGERLLQRFTEPNETRLGMSTSGVRGHGAAAKLGSDIWSELLADPLCQADVAILKRVEDLPVFVNGIDADITSDITTRIIVPALAMFTADMIEKHSEFESKDGLSDHSFTTWDPEAKQWVERTYQLPVVAGKPLLLVPGTWVGPRLLMTYGQYHQVLLLGFVQDERTVHVPGRKRPIRPTKKSIKEEHSYLRSRLTCINQTKRIADEGVDLVAKYRERADERAVPLTPEQIAKILER